MKLVKTKIMNGKVTLIGLFIFLSVYVTIGPAISENNYLNFNKPLRKILRRYNRSVKQNNNVTARNVTNSPTTATSINVQQMIETTIDEAFKSSQFGLKMLTATKSSITSTTTTTGSTPIDRKRQAVPTKSNAKITTVPMDRKKPVPKKYIPSTTPQEESDLVVTTKGPLKVSLSKSQKLSTPASDNLICPKETEAKYNLFAVACETHSDCISWNKEHRCCTIFRSRNCHQGVPKPLQEQTHKPILGLIPHRCPKNPLGELWWDLKTCETDDDCWPRICCPDGRNKYCRSTTPEYESIPFRIGRPLAYFSEYLECTPPPPAIFDVHPKSCNSTFDCFPNVCCQEAGKKNCRPPKKSVFSFMSNFLNNGLIKRLTNNLVIR